MNDYEIRKIKIDDVDDFFNMMCELDKETDFMMYEADERKKNVNALDNLKLKVQNILKVDDLLYVVDSKDNGIVGFIWAEKGKVNRTLHTAYIVVGIRSNYQNKGIGKSLFNELDSWARKNKIVRLELTVEFANDIAKHLYELNGFEVEGIRRKSMKVNGEFVDEYYMSKIYKY